ncbi:MAG: transposase [Candidatus Fermentibacteraceae bacterium]
MARIARIVLANIPHHVTQRGNRRQKVFFREPDYSTYLTILTEFTGRCGVDIWAYCLMPNHVHIVAVPSDPGNLTRALGEAHRRYTCRINRREGWTGHLWQGRYASFPMDDAHLLLSARYIEQNPVRAGLCAMPEQWRWSSARHHLGLESDPVISPSDLLNTFTDDWRGFLTLYAHSEEMNLLRRHEGSGRPLGDSIFLKLCESVSGMDLRPRRRGPNNQMH